MNESKFIHFFKKKIKKITINLKLFIYKIIKIKCEIIFEEIIILCRTIYLLLL